MNYARVSKSKLVDENKRLTSRVKVLERALTSRDESKNLAQEADNVGKSFSENVDASEPAQTQWLSDSLFKETFEKAAVGIAHVDTEGNWLRMNQRFCDMIGYTQEELFELTFQEITHPDDLNSDLEMVGQLLSGQINSYSIEKRYIQKNDNTIWIMLTVSMIRGHNREPDYMLGVIEDISARKRSEIELRKSEEQFKSIVDQLPNMVLIKDSQLHFTMANQKFREWFGFGEEEFIGKKSSDIFPNEIANEMDRIDQLVLESGKQVEQEIQSKFRDGTDHIVHLTKFVIKSVDGQNSSIGSIATDVTKRREIEQEVFTKEAQLSMALENMPGAIAVVDKDLNLVLINERYIEYYGDAGGLTKPGNSMRDILRHEISMGYISGEGKPEEKLEKRLKTFQATTPIVFQDEARRGRVVQVTRTPAPGGYSVSIATDISEIVQARRSEKLLREALDSFDDMFILYDKEERVIFTNDRYHEIYPNSPTKDEITNYTMETLLRRSLDAGQIDHPLAKSDPELWLSQALAKRREKAGSSGETTHSDGRTYFFRNSWTTEGGMILVQFDITKRKEAEAALRASEEQLRRILEDSPAAVAISCDDKSGEDGIVKFANWQFLDMFGYQKSDIGKFKTKDFSPEGADREEHQVALDAGKSFRNREQKFRTKDGGELWTLMSISSIEYCGGKSALIWFYDITDQKKAEQELSLQRLHLRHVLENVAQGVVKWSHDRKLVSFNNRFMEMLQLPETLMRAGSPLFDATYYLAKRGDFGQGNPKELANNRIEEVMSGAVRRSEISIGNDFTLDAQVQPTDDGGVIVTYTDITRRKEAEDELRLAKEKAESTLTDLRRVQAQLVTNEKLASLGELTAGIAHEIKNPLNFVNNFSETSVELLDELMEILEPLYNSLESDTREEIDELTGMLRGDLQKIKNHGHRADSIVKSMLLHARGDVSEPAWTQVNELVAEALNLAYHGERAKDPSFQTEMHQEFDKDVGEIQLVPQDITRVLVNLLSNAFYSVKKRSRETSDKAYQPTVSVTTHANADGILVIVRDNGIGISNEIQEKLFEPFFTTKPAGEGTGLGLSMCHDIVVQQHGGQLTVNSEVGAFTEIAVNLPSSLKNAKKTQHEVSEP